MAKGLAVAYQDDIIRDVASECKISYWFARQVVPAVFECIRTRMMKGESVHIVRFGTFHLKRVGARLCRIPGRASVPIRAHRYPAWRPGEDFADAVRHRTQQPQRPQRAQRSEP